jgi:hypothetical protein
MKAMLGDVTYTYHTRYGKHPGKLILRGPVGDLVVENPLATSLHTQIMCAPEGIERQEFIRKAYEQAAKK